VSKKVFLEAALTDLGALLQGDQKYRGKPCPSTYLIVSPRAGQMVREINRREQAKKISGKNVKNSKDDHHLTQKDTKIREGTQQMKPSDIQKSQCLKEIFQKTKPEDALIEVVAGKKYLGVKSLGRRPNWGHNRCTSNLIFVAENAHRRGTRTS